VRYPAKRHDARDRDQRCEDQKAGKAPRPERQRKKRAAKAGAQVTKLRHGPVGFGLAGGVVVQRGDGGEGGPRRDADDDEGEKRHAIINEEGKIYNLPVNVEATLMYDEFKAKHGYEVANDIVVGTCAVLTNFELE